MNTATGYTETELIRLLKQKDPVAINILYDKYGAPIYGFTSQVLHNKKLVNDTFVEVFLMITQTVHQFDSSKSRFFTWMMQIASQVTLQKLKSSTNRIYADSAVTIDSKSRDGLTGGEHQALDLAFLKGYSLDEVAGRMGIPARVVKEKMNKALLTINSQE